MHPAFYFYASIKSEAVGQNEKIYCTSIYCNEKPKKRLEQEKIAKRHQPTKKKHNICIFSRIRKSGTYKK